MTSPRPSGLAALLLTIGWLLGFPLLEALLTGTLMAASGPTGGLVGISAGVLTSWPQLLLWLGPPALVILLWLVRRVRQRPGSAAG